MKLLLDALMADAPDPNVEPVFLEGTRTLQHGIEVGCYILYEYP